MQYNFTYMWSLNKTNKQTRNKFTDTENILMVARWEGSKGVGEKREGIKIYKLIVTI